MATLPPVVAQLLDGLLAWILAHPEQTAALVLGFAGTATHYTRTGTLPIGRLPYRALRQTFRELGDQYFGRKRPRGVPGLVIETSADQLEHTLRSDHFESVDLYSYEYDGEVLNLRSPNGERPHPVIGQPVPMELHVRAFETADGSLFTLAHDEASRFEAWGDHVREALLSWERGRDGLQDVLDEASIDYEAVPSERQAGVEIVS